MINVDAGPIEKRLAYQRLKPHPVSRYEQLITDLFLQMQVGMWLIDQQNTLVECNAISTRYLGLERHEVLNRPIDHVISQLDISQPNYKQFVSFLTNTQQKQSELELEWDTKEGTCLFFVHKRPFFDSDSDFSGTLFVLENKTEEKSLAKQAQLNNRLATIGQIAAGTAHEIRNPLTSIRGFLQMIGIRLKENGQQKEHGYIDIMLKEINRINNLVSEFLLLSKPRLINRRMIVMHEVLEEILPIIQSEAILHNIEVDLRQEASEPLYLEADSELIKQIFLNLCKNAIEAMLDTGRLKIVISRDSVGKYAVAEITDQGPGIPNYMKDKIFNPFFTTKENGTGLGLPICKQILRELRGKMEVHSNENGTTFRVYLPLVTPIS